MMYLSEILEINFLFRGLINHFTALKMHQNPPPATQIFRISWRWCAPKISRLLLPLLLLLHFFLTTLKIILFL